MPITPRSSALGLALAVAVALSGLVLSGTALAQDSKLGLGIRTPVEAGSEKPAVLIQPTASVKSLAVTVERVSDGKQFFFNIKGIRKGSKKALDFDQRAGAQQYQAQFAAKFNDGSEEKFGITFEAVVTGALEVEVNRKGVDLDGRRLVFETSRPVAKAEVTVYGEGGKVVGQGSAEYSGKGRKQTLTWEQEPANVRRLEVKVTDAGGFWAGIEVRAFYVEPWEDRIYFATGSHAIETSEKPKLDKTFARIEEALQMAKEEYGDNLDLRLYIAGYTDTVGSTSSNQALSERRAKSIGNYFRKKGLTLAIKYQGFGESVLAVQTADNTDEERNRRTLYVLSSQTPVSSAFPRNAWRNL